MYRCRCCDEPASLRCSACTVPTAWYCSKKCQRELWLFHIFECNPQKPINTAYHLARAVYKDYIPEDMQTCEDYGFNRAFTADNRTNLFGLYVGLIKYHGVEPGKIHKWRVQGKLIQEIKTTFEELPKDNQGHYYRWFLQNQWVLDNTVPPPDVLHQFLAPGWQYASGNNLVNVAEIDAVKATWPESKRDCLELCTCLLAKWHPSPNQKTWLTFGFCVCQEDTEPALARLYLQLMEKCSFGELHAAYASSSLISLFHSKGLKAEFGKIRHLRAILEDTPTWIKPIWHLKQYALSEKSNMIVAMGADYGFSNCKNEAETVQLKDVYRQFFQHREADPMKLHEAAARGKTFEYIQSLVKLKESERKTIQRLMVNPNLDDSLISNHAGLAISVWDLKEFVVENGNLIPSIGVDYGFFNCKDEVERALLKHAYLRFFQHEANPMKLHEAAIGGKIFEYIDSLVKLKKNDRKTLRRLMKNPYPLPEYD